MFHALTQWLKLGSAVKLTWKGEEFTGTNDFMKMYFFLRAVLTVVSHSAGIAGSYLY